MPAEVPAAGLEPCKEKTFPFGVSIDSSELKIKGALKSSGCMVLSLTINIMQDKD